MNDITLNSRDFDVDRNKTRFCLARSDIELIVFVSIMLCLLPIPSSAYEVDFTCATLGKENKNNIYISGTYTVDKNRNYKWEGPLIIEGGENFPAALKGRDYSQYKGKLHTTGQFFKLELRDQNSSTISIMHPEGTERQSNIQFDIKSIGKTNSYIEQFTNADCRFLDSSSTRDALSNSDKLFKTISVKCPKQNSGILDQLRKSGDATTIRQRYKYINGAPVKYIYEIAMPGKPLEIKFVFDAENPGTSENASIGRSKIAEAKTVFDEYCISK